MPRKLDTYEKWVKEGKASAYLSSIRRWVGENATQKQVAESLHITEKTLIELKKKHHEIQEAFQEGDDNLRFELESAIFKRAKGMKLEDEVQTYELVDGGKRKQRIVKTKKEIPPDTQAAIYLLQTKFGRKYNPRKDQLDILERKAEKEVWVDVDDDEYNEAVEIIRQDKLNRTKQKAALLKERQEQGKEV